MPISTMAVDTELSTYLDTHWAVSNTDFQRGVVQRCSWQAGMQ